jgi:hypothetical protein
MTVTEALAAVRQVGTIGLRDGKIVARFHPTEAFRLQPAIDLLKEERDEALVLLSEPDPAELARASDIMTRTGSRIMTLSGGVLAIGIWSDLDWLGVRAALRVFDLDQLPVRYLDGAGIPLRYKVRRVDGEPVPLNVLIGMEQNPAEPWKHRDRMLAEIGWGAQPIPVRRAARKANRDMPELHP